MNRGYFEVKKGNSLSQILWEMITRLPKPWPELYGRDGAVGRTMKLNPQIKNKDRLQVGLTFQVPPYLFFEMIRSRQVGETASAKPVPRLVEVPPETVSPQIKTAKPAAAPALSTVQASVSLAYTDLWYQETGISMYNQSGLTIRATLQNTMGWLFKSPNWVWGGNAFVTVATLKSSIPGVSARWLGVNGRFGYVFRDWGAWNLSAWTGIYYTTMMVSAADANDLFGVQDIMGPQFYTILRRRWNNGVVVRGFAKWAPVGQGMSLSFPGKELAWGVSVGIPQKSLMWSVGIEQSKLTVEVLESQIAWGQFSISAGLTW